MRFIFRTVMTGQTEMLFAKEIHAQVTFNRQKVQLIARGH